MPLPLLVPDRHARAALRVSVPWAPSARAALIGFTGCEPRSRVAPVAEGELGAGAVARGKRDLASQYLGCNRVNVVCEIINARKPESDSSRNGETAIPTASPRPDRKSTRLNSSHRRLSRMPSSA